MIKRLRVSSIWSEDLNNLLPFHRDVLDLRPGLDTPGFVVLGDREAPAVAFGTHSDVRGRASEPATTLSASKPTTSRRSTAGSRRRASSSWEEPKDFGNVWVATFEDPEGNVLQLLQFQP